MNGEDNENVLFVEDVFEIPNNNRGTVVTGIVGCDVLSVGQNVEWELHGFIKRASVSGIEMDRHLLDEAGKGDAVGLLLKHVHEKEIVPGCVLRKTIMRRSSLMVAKDYSKVKMVMGWDIGDGDSVAYARFVSAEAGSSDEMWPLYLEETRDQVVVPSVVSVTAQGRSVVGFDAAKQGNFEINFKRAPRDWEGKSSSNKSYKEHMRDFIKGVSETILKNSSNRKASKKVVDIEDTAHWRKDEVLLLVGCPAAKIWKEEGSRRQYEELISEATGIRNVVVRPESTAAVFSLLGNRNLRDQIDLQKGVLVLDFGSSTADATCIIPGKKEINLSWELGANQIEEAMLHYIVEGKKCQDALKNKAKKSGKLLIDTENCKEGKFTLRENKEDFYRGIVDENRRIAVELPIMNEDGDPVIIDDDDNNNTISIFYRIESEMMQYAVGCDYDADTKKIIVMPGYEFEAKEEGRTASKGTWRQNCLAFMKTVRQKLEKEKVSVERVVVTGGASNMPFVPALAGEVFGANKVITSVTPSHSVVEGLATMAYNEVKAAGVRGDAITKIDENCKTNCENMLEELAGRLASTAYGAATAALNNMCNAETGLGTKASHIVDTVQPVIYKAIDDNIKQIRTECDTKWKNSDVSEIVTQINEASKALYADRAVADMIRIEEKDIQSNNWNPQGIIGNKIDITEICVRACYGPIVLIIQILLAIVTLPLAFLESIFDLDGLMAEMIDNGGEAILKWIKDHDFPITYKAVRRAVRNMENMSQAEKDKVIAPIKRTLHNTYTKPEIYGENFEKHYEEIRKSANKAFDLILLEADEC